MGRRKTDKEQIRKIQSSGGSYFVSLPIGELRELGWQEGQKVVIKKRGQGFSIADWPPRSPKATG